MIAAEMVLSSVYEGARQAVEELIEKLSSGESRELTHGEAESLIEGEGRKILRELFQGWLKEQGNGDVGPKLFGIDKVKREEKRIRTRKLESLFGEVEVSRYSYEETGVESLRPLDAKLNMPKEIYSHGVRKRVAKQASKESFSEVIEGIGETSGAHVSRRQAEELTVKAARDVDDFYKEHRSEEGKKEESKAPILVMSIDGKGVPMRKSDLLPETAKKAEKQKAKSKKSRSKKEKSSFKRMASVAAVYTTSEFIRTAEQVVSELQPVREAMKERRPTPENKRIWASIAKNQEQVVKEMFKEALARDPKREKRWEAVVDGNKSQIRLIRKYAKLYKVKLDLVLDLIHVLEYLWKAAYVFYEHGSFQAEQWVREALWKILKGQAKNVAANIRRQATRAQLSPKERNPADSCARYLCTYATMLCYNDYLAAGLPIASGVIEGACRHLVKDRMEITGARWRLQGAEAVLRLRAVYINGDFDEYWSFHLRKELERNHASHYLQIPSLFQEKSPSAPLNSYLRLMK